MSSPLWKVLGLLKSDKNQIRSPYTLRHHYLWKRALSSLTGYPNSFHATHVGSIPDTTNMRRGVFTWGHHHLGSRTYLRHLRRCWGEKAERTGSEHAIFHSLHLSGQVFKDKSFKDKCKQLMISNCHRPAPEYWWKMLYVSVIHVFWNLFSLRVVWVVCGKIQHVGLRKWVWFPF